MSFARSLFSITLFATCLAAFALVACGQRPPIETTILPAVNETATPFLNINVAAAQAELTVTPTETVESIPPTIAPVVFSTDLPTATVLAISTLTPTATVRATETISPGTIISQTTPTVSATITTTVSASVTSTVSSSLTTTVTAEATPCFGSVNGSVVADLNGNGKAEAGEPGVLGAKLFLYNASGVVGLYTTGNGQFNFPGLVAGKYTLTAAPPTGFAPVGQPSYDLELKCGETFTQTILFNSSSAPVNATPTPTAQSKSKITPVASERGTPRASKSGSGESNFKPFQVAAVYDIAGCGSITAPGLYRLATSLTSQWDCIQIFSDNVIFDCQGNALNGRDYNGYGVVVHQIGNVLSQRPARNIEIRNCKSNKHRYGIFIDAVDNLYIHDNEVSNQFRDTDERNFGQFLGLTEGGGIRVGSTSNALIADNRADNSAIGIDVRNSNGITVRGNSTNGNSAWGVHFYNVQNSKIAENTATDNLRYCTWGNGTVGPGCDAGGIMLQSGSSKNTIQNNTITGSNGNGIFIKAHGTPCGDGNVIQGNTISGSLYNAIELSFCRDNKIQENRISNSLDGIWLGFAQDNAVVGNQLQDLGNHGIISWNSSDNNISTNTITNSREGLYFYSSDYDREQFFFVQGSPEDHTSRGNCLCDNTLRGNTVAAIHLNNSVKNQITQNRLTGNGINFVMEGNTAGNIIQDNEIQGGAYNIDTPHAQNAAYRSSLRDERSLFAQSNLGVPSIPRALTAYDAHGRTLTRAEFLRAIAFDDPNDSFDLQWFKFKLRVMLAGKEN